MLSIAHYKTEDAIKAKYAKMISILKLSYLSEAEIREKITVNIVRAILRYRKTGVLFHRVEFVAHFSDFHPDEFETFFLLGSTDRRDVDLILDKEMPISDEPFPISRYDVNFVGGDPGDIENYKPIGNPKLCMARWVDEVMGPQGKMMKGKSLEPPLSPEEMAKKEKAKREKEKSSVFDTFLKIFE